MTFTAFSLRLCAGLVRTDSRLSHYHRCVGSCMECCVLRIVSVGKLSNCWLHWVLKHGGPLVLTMARIFSNSPPLLLRCVFRMFLCSCHEFSISRHVGKRSLVAHCIDLCRSILLACIRSIAVVVTHETRVSCIVALYLLMRLMRRGCVHGLMRKRRSGWGDEHVY